MTRHFQITLEGDFKKQGCRFHTFLAAQTLNLYGAVSEKDGKIIIDAEGSEESLDEFIRWCKRGNGKKPTVQVVEKPRAYYCEFLIL